MTSSTPADQDPGAAAAGADGSAGAPDAPAGDPRDPGSAAAGADGSAQSPGQPTDAAPQRTPEKDPSEWATGGEPATGPQLSYLSTLAQEAGVEVPETLTKADASKMIDELQGKTGRGGEPAGG